MAEDKDHAGDSQIKKEKKKKRKYLVPPAFRVRETDTPPVIRTKDLRDLIVWLAADEHQASPPAPTWVGVQNKPAIERVVSVLIPGLDPNAVRCGKISGQEARDALVSAFPVLQEFEFVNVLAPGSRTRMDSYFNAFTRVPLTKSERKQAEQNRKATSSAKLALADLVLSPEQLKDLGYPLELKEGWFELEPSSDQTKPPQTLALDCEMCDTQAGKVLTRISVVDMNCKILYTSFVKPELEITNYLTPYSGITAELLEPVTTTLQDVQQWFRENVTKEDILVGHSLECDLNVLQLVHRQVIDTAIIYQHAKGLPWRPALRNLAQQYLKLEIQKGTDGHDPTQDASTCVQLVHLKCEKGMSFGIQDQSVSLLSRLHSLGKSAAVVDTSISWPNPATASLCLCCGDSEIVAKTVSMAKSHYFTHCRLHLLEHRWRAQETSEDKINNDANENESTKTNDTEKLTEAQVASLSSYLKTLASELPPNTALIVWTGQSDPRKMSALFKSRAEARNEFQTKKWDEARHWGTAEENELAAAIDAAREGLGFLTVLSDEPVSQTNGLHMEDSQATVESGTEDGSARKNAKRQKTE